MINRLEGKTLRIDFHSKLMMGKLLFCFEINFPTRKRRENFLLAFYSSVAHLFLEAAHHTRGVYRIINDAE